MRRASEIRTLNENHTIRIIRSICLNIWTNSFSISLLSWQDEQERRERLRVGGNIAVLEAVVDGVTVDDAIVLVLYVGLHAEAVLALVHCILLHVDWSPCWE